MALAVISCGSTLAIAEDVKSTDTGHEAPKGAVKGKAKETEKSQKVPSDYSYYIKSGHRSPKWNEFIQPGFQTFDSGNLATSYIFLKKAYDQGCRDGLALYRMGLYKETLKQYPEAAVLLAEAAVKIPEQYPKHPLANGIHEHAGRVLYLVGDYDGALPELAKAVKIAPNNFTLLFMTGQLLRMKKQYAEAISIFELALEAPIPEGVTADVKLNVTKELMIVTCELKEFTKCAAYADQLLRALPNDPTANAYKQKLLEARQKGKEREMIERIVK